MKSKISNAKIYLLITWLLFIWLTPNLFCHGPDQVDHNFYLYTENSKLILRWEIPFGEILGYIQRQKMDINKDNIISKEEQQNYLKKFTQEHLKDLTILLNNQNNLYTLLDNQLDLETEKVIAQAMLVKIFLELNISKQCSDSHSQQNTNICNVSLYLEDKADQNITQFINFYTNDTIKNSKLDKQLLHGEERKFSVSFQILISNKQLETPDKTDTHNNIKPNTLSEKIKNYLFIKDISIKILIILFCFAISLGSLHALEPGHGKSIMTAYVLATQGNIFDIFILGTVIVLSHTIVVIILGVITLYLSQYILPQTIYPYLGLFSSLLIILIGFSLIKRNSVQHNHSHDNADFKDGKINFKDLIQFGIAGGLVPCPAAIAILLTAIQLNKVVLGLLLIIALSIGIALTLTCVGLSAIYAKKIIFKSQNNATKKYVPFLPIVSGIFITTLGVILLLKIFEDLKIFKITLQL